MKRFIYFAAILAITALIPLGNAGAQPLNDECLTAEAVGEGTFPWDNTGSLIEGPIDCDANMSVDVWFLYTATSSGTAVIETCLGGGTNDDTVLIVYDALAGCPTAGAPCLASGDDECENIAGGAGFMSQVQVPVISGESYYVQVGGWNGATGDGALNIFFPAAEICDDGVDNDVDGLIDCFDPDCVGAPNCFEGDSATCGDGIDNDGDGTIDCQDLDCAGIPPCGIEICDDGIDNDGDLIIDCFDTDCIGDPFCFEGDAATCGDGIDNDGDGAIDCADADCGGIGICGVEICDDGFDNDGDGLIDCSDDIDCPLGTVFCPIVDNDECLTAQAIGEGNFPWDNTASLVDGPNDCDANMQNDVWFLYTASADGTAVIETCLGGGTNADSVLIVYDALAGCPTAGAPCLASGDDECENVAGGAGFMSQVQVPVISGESYYVQVGGWNGATGDGALNIFFPGAEICDDGIDNDVDGLIDCLDPDCGGTAACGTEICDDGIDNDGDTIVDCLDPDCAGSAACGTEICDDGVDNDGDTLADCFDPDCATFPTCFEGDDISCSDGIDNDVDGLTDCFDPDCIGTGPCQAAPNDDCVNAELVGEGNFAWDNTISTLDGPIDCDDNMTNDVWFLYTATADGTAVIQTCDGGGTNDDSVLIVYDGLAGCPTGPGCIGSGDDDCANIPGGAAFMSSVEIPVIAGESYYVQVGGWNGTLGAGFLDISVSCGATAINNFNASYSCATSTSSLTWDDGGFDTYDVLRDGVVLAAGLAAGTTSYTDSNALSNGTYEYTVTGNCASGSAVSASVFVNVSCASGTETDIIFKTETDLGQINSTAALEAALTANGISFLTVVDFPASQLGNVIGTYERVWVCSGTFPEDGPLTTADSDALALWVEAGIGVYFEGGDMWGFAPTVGAFEGYDGVLSALDGDDTFLSVSGLDTLLGVDFSGIQNVPYNQDAAGNDWTDQLTVGPEAGGPNVGAIWQEGNGAYITGAYSQNQDLAGSPIGNVLVQSWEFGGYGGDQVLLAADIIEALGGGGTTPTDPEFVRGDCNADGGFNIADSIFLLAALFSGGPAGTCLDACDANDDGGINIADAIYALAALFSGGPAPTPTSCGVDPTTTDPLDCASFPPCP